MGGTYGPGGREVDSEAEVLHNLFYVFYVRSVLQMEFTGKDFRAMVQRVACGLYRDIAKSIGNCLKLRCTDGYQNRVWTT